MADNYNARLYARGYAQQKVTTRTSSAPTTSTSCAPACADCGLLECLCRPRFFAGQLLTETDLNRLDAYIRAKNRMHNVQLHGWGVVNGLQVRCDSCNDDVIVGTGYAIDPCGEDIVVCGDTAVDICALIQRCQPADSSCAPASRNPRSSGCDDVEESWVLAIRYSETQARGITALRSTPSCSCRAGAPCSCSSSTSSSCGCGNKSASSASSSTSSTSTTKTPRSAPADCEATAICEGYAFDVYPAPDDAMVKGSPFAIEKDTLTGGMMDTFQCCFDPLQNALPAYPTGTIDANTDAWVLWACRTKEALVAFFTVGPQANCNLAAKVQNIAIPKQEGYAYEVNMAAVLVKVREELMVLRIEAMFACLCSALLPPAPCGTSDDRVPLAVVTVRKRDCKILRVCNWTPQRKLVFTMPTLQYWLGWIPMFSSLREALARLCCDDIDVRAVTPLPVIKGNVVAPASNVPAAKQVEKQVAPADAPAANNATNSTTTTPTADPLYEATLLKLNPTLDSTHASFNQIASTLLLNAIARGNTPLTPAAVMSGVFGLPTTDAIKSPMTATEQANVGPFLLLHQLARPLVTSAVPTNLTSDETASLKTRVAALEQAIAKLGGTSS